VLHFASVPDSSWRELDPKAVADSKNLPERFFALSNQLTANKNHMIVCEAVRRLRDRGVNVSVACTGSTWDHRGGDYIGQVNAYLDQHDLRDRIFILGMLPRAEQMAVIRRSMAMLQPSRFEGWATAVEDAKSLGKIIIASSIDVHREQLGDDYPWYADVDDADAWASMMEAVARDRNAGPYLIAESSAADALAIRMRECGETFVSILEQAITASGMRRRSRNRIR
jgi:glycosyltransferase involved in cell wall biosynthesis